ncbi:MAG: methyltransferase family protein, partial [Candidatus Hermodarchaeota archaeon]
MTEQRKPPPIRVMVPVVFALFSAISITVIFLLSLPWILPLPLLWAVGMGIALLAVGFPIMISALRSLRAHRALGDEIYMTREESRLITTGAYAYTRNPLYFSATILLMGWTLVFTSTFLLIVTMLFLPLFRFAAKWEEEELAERFGEEYLSYKESVPFFFPRP